MSNLRSTSRLIGTLPVALAILASCLGLAAPASGDGACRTKAAGSLLG